MRACLCPFSTLNVSETTACIGGWLLLGAYRKVDGQNRLVTSLMTSRDPMTSARDSSTSWASPAQQVPQPVGWGYRADAPTNIRIVSSSVPGGIAVRRVCLFVFFVCFSVFVIVRIRLPAGCNGRLAAGGSTVSGRRCARSTEVAPQEHFSSYSLFAVV